MTALLLGLLGGRAGASAVRTHVGRTGAAQAAGPTVKVGINDPKDPQIAVLAFMPRTVKVAVGTPLTWAWEGTIEPHSVTFLPPGTPPPNDETTGSYLPRTDPPGPYDGTTLANSGLEPLITGSPTPSFTMSFATPGKYTYYCILHPGMRGTVDVVAAGSKAQTPAQVSAAGKAEQQRWLAEGRSAKRRFEAAKPRKVRGPNGTTTWTVAMGTSTAHTDIDAFAPAPTRVHQGDSVTFVNGSKAPHTATFPGQQPPITSTIAPETKTAIPGPSPQTLNSTDLFNSGQLPGAYPPAPGEPVPSLAARSFTFVVPAPGTYGYYCILHVEAGMGAKVVARE
jgi:plastocyanin